ncbi:hypothetical protein L211DRAFT_801346, partial [Terfezia boudieri ATCC MYA-4762]
MSDVSMRQDSKPIIGNPKVPIPRLLSSGQATQAQEVQGTQGAQGRTKAIRVAHACERCKVRKIRCNGERPTCNSCKEDTPNCRYIEKKRDTEKRRVYELEVRAKLYEKLLRDVKPHVTHSGLQLAVEKALTGDTAHHSNHDDESLPPIPRRLSPPLNNEVGPSTPGDHRGLPTASFEHISQDINTFSVNNPFGYLGKSSCLWWIQRAREQLRKSIPLVVAIDTMVDPRVPSVEKLDATMYHLDDLGMPETGRDVSPFEIPPKGVADVLVYDYFRTVHCAFPILSKTIFLSQYEQLYRQNMEPIQAGVKWLAIFNLVLAIGRTHCNLVGEAAGYDYQADYFLRARILGALDGALLFQIPDLQQVQMLGLAANYLLVNHRINRAWNVGCLAICKAQGLGLHLDSDAPSLDTLARNIRNCVWHTLYSIETALVLITGRVPLIREVHCSVPVPGTPCHENLDDKGHVMPDPYLFSQRGLFAIINESVMILYNTQNYCMSPAAYQEHVARFEARLTAWKSQIPEGLSFENLPTRVTDAVIEREKRLDLAVRYHNARMIIHRPFLCINESTIKNESIQPGYSPLNSARACIGSACKLITLVTSEDPQTMMRCGPWWSLVHFLSTAASVIMLELAFYSRHVPEDHQRLFRLGDRIVEWFKALQNVDVSSKRCFIVLDEMMKLLRLRNNIPSCAETLCIRALPPSQNE